MSDTVRWGILGTARIAAGRVVPAIHAVTGASLYAVASRDAERAEAFAQESEAAVHYGNYDALIADENVDAVYIPLPNALHARWARAALEAGKAVLCEKPLTADLATTEDLVAFADARGLLLAEGFMYRHHPTTARIAELLQEGAIGAVRVARGALSFVLTDRADIRSRPELGGGALLDLGCYPVDALCRLYGTAARRAECVRVVGETGVDEQVFAVLDFGQERIGAVDCSFRLPWLESVFEIRGEAGTIRALHAFNPGRSATTVTLIEPGGKVTEFPSPPCDMFAAMIKAFTLAVRGEEAYPFDVGLSLLSARTMALIQKLPTAEPAGEA